MPWVYFEREKRRCSAEPGQDLRSVAIQEGINIYPRPFNVLNCGGKGLCGSCQVEVINPHSVSRKRPPIKLGPIAVDLDRLHMRLHNLQFREKLPGFNLPLWLVGLPLLIGLFTIAYTWFVVFANGKPVLDDLFVSIFKLSNVDRQVAWQTTWWTLISLAVFYGSWVGWILFGLLAGPGGPIARLFWPKQYLEYQARIKARREEQERRRRSLGRRVLACQTLVGQEDVIVRTLVPESVMLPVAEYERQFAPESLRSETPRTTTSGGGQGG